MSDTLLLQILTGVHLLGSATFVGSNILLELLIKRLELIPPRQAARVSDRLGVDLAVLNFTALALIAGTGVARLFVSDLSQAMTRLSFYGSSYGAAMTVMIGLWVTLVVSASLLTFYLRPRVIVKLPYDATREEVGDRIERSMQLIRWMRLLGRYNIAAGIAAFVVGGFIRYGGF